jgi:hypothetical protein
MKYSLEDIWVQALEDTYAITLDGSGYQARMVYGLKIVKDDETNEIQLINATRGGDYYREVNAEELKVFLEKGWRYGVYVLSLSNYRLKLDLIEQKIHKEMNSRKSKKQIDMLKGSRKRVMNKYSEINYKLNQLKLWQLNQ